MKVDEKYVPPRTVLRDFEEIHSSLESALPRQRTGDVRKSDRTYARYNDVAITHSIATSYLYVTTLPDSHRLSDFASADSIAELFREDHGAWFRFPQKKSS